MSPEPYERSIESGVTPEHLPNVTFHTRTSNVAEQGLLKSRSEIFLLSANQQEKEKVEQIESRTTIWDRKPIDFSVKNYQPCPPKRNTRESMIKGWNENNTRELQHQPKDNQTLALPTLVLPQLLKTRENTVNFSAKYRPISSQTSRIMFLRTGTLPRDPYSLAEPHQFRGDNFRPLEDMKWYGKPEFVTSIERDPSNISFKRKMLQKTLPDLSTTKTISIRQCQSEPVPKLCHGSKWTKESHLPKLGYKKGRSAHSALMQRIKLKLDWLDDKDKLHVVSRPDIFDNNTIDWLAVTKTPSLDKGPFPLG